MSAEKSQSLLQRKELWKIIRNVHHTIETSEYSVLITDASGIVLYANEAFCTLTGYRQAEILGKLSHFFSVRQRAPSLHVEMWDAISRGKLWRGEFLSRKKSGEEYWERVLILPIFSPLTKEVSHYLSIKEDITQHKRAELQKEQRRKEIHRELSDANLVQKSFLPADMETHQFRLRTYFEPCSALSGDFFDYVWLKKENKLVGYILDVMGHGVAAALQGAALRILSRSILHSPLLLEKRMQLLNHRSFESLADESFAGSILFEINFRTKKLCYVTAGINYFLHHSDQQTKIVKGSGIFLGLDADAAYNKHDLSFRCGDSFCFMSDGLFDNLNREILKAPDLETTFERLSQLLQKSQPKDDATGIFIATK